jgi:hypothetical protein
MGRKNAIAAHDPSREEALHPPVVPGSLSGAQISDSWSANAGTSLSQKFDIEN